MKSALQALLPLLLATLPLPAQGAASLVGQKLPVLTLEGESGGLVDGKPWSSTTINGRVRLFFYIDPDERELNEDMTAAVKAEAFPADKFGSISVLNMAATWLPNSVLSSKLEDKQKEFPHTVFAKDLNKTLVTKWQLKDDDYVVLVFDKQGTVLFSREGQFSKDDIQAMIKVIKEHLDDPAA